MVALGVILLGPELRMVIQMPARELACRNSAGNRIQEREDSLGDWPPSFEHGVVNDFVEKNCEIENREALNHGKRDPDQWVLEVHESPGCANQDCELSSCDQEVPRGHFPVQSAHLVARDRLAQLSSERNRMLRVVMRLHGSHSILAGIRDAGIREVIQGLGLISADPRERDNGQDLKWTQRKDRWADKKMTTRAE
jgi:hypothetical protein